jgi:hypothetical protein
MGEYKFDPPLHGMRCAIVALMTFLVVARENPAQSFSKTRLPFVIVIQYLLYLIYDSTPNSNLLFAIFVLC